jgi:hypothetical protein
MMSLGRFATVGFIGIGVAALAGGGGCFRCPTPTVHEEEQGLVWVCPGIGGGAWYLGDVYRAFRAAGINAEIRIQEWDTPFYNAMGHLQAIESNRKQAQLAAETIAEYRRVHSRVPIDVVGYSAGGGMAVLVVEALPADVRVQNVVLVQAAVSPEYDLSAVLAHVDGHLTNLYSPLDWLVLGVGTSTFGTVDRKFVASAGKVGFKLEAAVPDEREREKVQQRPWVAPMIWAGHFGNHASILGYGWNKAYVAPYVWGTAGAAKAPAAGGSSDAGSKMGAGE